MAKTTLNQDQIDDLVLSVSDSDILFSDIVTNNVSTTKHGFAPKLPNDSSKFLDGTGNYTTPAPAFDAWIASPAWTRVSNNSFTVSGDYSGIIVKGTKLKYTQSSTQKYAVVVSSTYSNPSTTVTVAANNDYSIAASAISDEFYSYIATPPGYTGFFNYTPTFGGFSSDPSGGSYSFNIQGTLCLVTLQVIATASNSTTFTVSAPVANAGPPTFNALAYIMNNNVQVTNATGMAYLATGSSTITVDLSIGWTASNNKAASFELMYSI